MKLAGSLEMSRDSEERSKGMLAGGTVLNMLGGKIQNALEAASLL